MASYPQANNKDYLFEKGQQMSEGYIAYLENGSYKCPQQVLGFTNGVPSRRCSEQSEGCLEKAYFDDDNSTFRILLDQKINGGDLHVDGNDEANSTGTGSNQDDEKVVPDGGWGWVVCFGSFMVNFILDGTMFSFGVLLLYLLDDFGQDEATTSWVGSAQMGVHMCMGPVISYLLKRYTIRQVTIAGSLLATAGFIASVFAPNIYVLIFTFGVIGGIGFGMVFLPALIVVGLYFNRKRAIATGIATSGSGVGVFAYAYITDTLVESYGWRGTVLILAGVLLNCLVCGLLFRPLLTLNSTEVKVSPPPSTSSATLKAPLEQDGHSASSGYSSEPASVKLSIQSILSGSSTGDAETRTNGCPLSLEDLYTEIEPAMEKPYSVAEHSRRVSDLQQRGGDADSLANKDVQYTSSCMYDTILARATTSKHENTADYESCRDLENTVHTSGGDGVCKSADPSEHYRGRGASVGAQTTVPVVFVSDFSDAGGVSANSPLLDSDMQLFATSCEAQSQTRLSNNEYCKYTPKEQNKRLLVSTTKRASIANHPVHQSANGPTSSHPQKNLPSYLRDIEGSGCFNRPFISMDHIHRMDKAHASSAASPMDSPRRMYSEHKLHDFSRRMSMCVPEPLTPGPPSQLICGSRTDIQNQICKGLMKPILRRDIYYSGSINNLPTFQQCGGSISTFMAAMTRASSIEDSDEVQLTADDPCSDSVCCQGLKRILPMHLLTNKCFVFLLITFTMWTAQSSFMTYLPQLAVSLDIARSDAASLISVVGIANVLGRLLAGAVVDLLRIPGIWLYVVSLTVAALINLAIPFVTSFVILQICAAVFGLCMAVTVSMRTIVLAEQLGIEALTESFGVVAFFQGVAFTVNPPLAGTLIDVFDSYTLPFFMAAGMYAVSAVCSILCGFFTAAERRRTRVDSTSTDESSLVLA